MKNLLLASACFILFRSVLFAADDRPVAEVFAGYSANRQTGSSVVHGWNASIAGNFTDYFSVVADVSEHILHNSAFGVTAAADILAYRFGPQVTWRNASRLTPFAHVLIGGVLLGISAGGQSGSTTFTTSDSISGWSTASGGGLDIAINDSISARVVQVDYNTWYFGGNPFNGVRASFGLVFKLH